MAKLTRKDKKAIRTKVRKWAAALINNAELPEEMMWAEGEENAEALAYLHSFKKEVADGLDFVGPHG